MPLGISATREPGAIWLLKDLLPERFGQTFQVLRTDVDQAVTWSIDVGDQQKRYRNDKRQHESKLTKMPRPITQQQVATQRHSAHQIPRRRGNTVPVCGLSV